MRDLAIDPLEFGCGDKVTCDLVDVEDVGFARGMGRGRFLALVL